MKIIISLLIFILIFGKSSAALFGENSATSTVNKASANYSNGDSDSNIKSEIRALKKQISEKQKVLKAQTQKKETQKLRSELAELKKLVKDRFSEKNSNSYQGMPNITINNSPVNNNTNSNINDNSNSGGNRNSVTDMIRKNLNNRKHRLSIGVTHLGNYLIGQLTDDYQETNDSMNVLTASYSYIGDMFYLGGYLGKGNGDSSSSNSNYWQYYWQHTYTASYDNIAGLKLGLSLFNQDNLSINPYFSYNKITGDYNYSNYSWNNYYSSGTGELQIAYKTVGVDAFLDINDSFALQFGADYVLSREIDSGIITGSFTPDDNKFAKFYGGLSAKF
jgi:hypothetical protein